MTKPGGGPDARNVSLEVEVVLALAGLEASTLQREPGLFAGKTDGQLLELAGRIALELAHRRLVEGRAQ